ncbi:MAG: hypothetical protein ACLVKJ_09420 [Acutalibacteraceae bacterium]
MTKFVALKQEIIRRYYQALCEKEEPETKKNISKLENLMQQAQITVEDRKVIVEALKKEKETDGKPAVALELPNGKIVTGSTSDLLEQRQQLFQRNKSFRGNRRRCEIDCKRSN